MEGGGREREKGEMGKREREKREGERRGKGGREGKRRESGQEEGEWATRKQQMEGQRLDKCLHIQAGTHPMYVDNDTICLLHTPYLPY